MKVKLFRLFVFWIVLSCWIPHVASAEVVNMPDEALAAVVRDKLGLAPDAPITQQALQRLYGLGAPRRLESSRLIKDLTGLEHATALRTLDLLSHAVDDLRPLSGLRQLRYLRLDNNQLSDIAPLSGLWLLADLSLDNNQLSDITPLKSLKQLATLSLSQNQLSDITPLSDLTQLRWLSLDNNQLSDVTPLSGLWRLGYLRLDQNQIRDVTPLKGLKRLRYLRLDQNQIRDVTSIQHLIDSKNVSVRLAGNPIGEPPEKANLVIESVTADKTTLEPGQTFTLTATLKNRGVGKAEAPIYYRWHRSTHPNIHKMEGSDKVLTGAREEIGEKRIAVRSIVEFKKTEDVSLGTNQSSKQYIALTAPQESGIYYYSVCVESPPNESDESDNCSSDVRITVLPDLTGDGSRDENDFLIVVAQFGLNRAPATTGDTIEDITDPTVKDIYRDYEASGVISDVSIAVKTHADLNTDGTVDFADIELIAKVLEDAGVFAAPNITRLTPDTIQQWIMEARQMWEGDPTFFDGIAALEQFHTLLPPMATALLSNYPNPFNPETWIPYQLAKPADVRLTIYDVNGRIVRTLDVEHQRAGRYQDRARAAYWDGRNTHGEPVASGVYFYMLSAGDFTATRRMLIRK